MLKSMTGYGRSELRDGKTRIVAEVKCVNNRFLDVLFSLPPALDRYEQDLRKVVEGFFRRGRLEVRMEAELENTAARVAEPDLAFAQSLRRALEQIARELSVPLTLSLDTLCLVPGLIVPARQERDLEPRELGIIRQVLSEALQAADAMRLREGEALARDLRAKADAVEAWVTRIEALAPAMKELFLAKLRERVAQYASDAALNEDRLYQEAVFLAERSDITEELVRLKSHVAQFRATLDSEEAAGKKLDFLAQEMHREGNTIASKARAAEITTLTLDIRSEVEKVREQVRNIE